MRFFSGEVNLSSIGNNTKQNETIQYETSTSTEPKSVLNNFLKLKYSHQDSNSHYESSEFFVFIFGRIDNLDSIQKRYNKKNAFNEAHLILNLYFKYANSFIEKISGPFIICIIDKQTKKISFYRDHIGLRPMYYVHTKKKIYFSSSINNILESKSIKPEINKNRVVCFITHTCGHKTETFFKGIMKMPPSSYLIISINETKLKDYNFLKLSKEKLTFNQYRVELKKALENSIRQLSKKNQKVASKLSGGLDSSSIGALLINGEKKTDHEFYSVVYEFEDNRDFLKVDESKYMSSFESFYGIKSKKILIKEDKMIDPFLYDSEDEEPNFIVNRYFDIRILKECSKDGHSIIFDGFDGDSIISYGVNHLYDLGKSFKVKELLRQKKILEETGEKKNNNTLKFLIKYMILPNLPLSIFNLLNYLRGVEDSEVIGHRFLSKDTVKNYPLENLNNKFQIKKYSYLKSEEIHKKVIEWPIWDQILEINFRDSNKYDVEEVFPFLDKEVINLAVNIPTEYKLKNGYKRFILREALKDILPEEIYKRTRKSDLSPAIDNYFKKLKKEKKYEELLLGQNSPLEGLIEKKLVREIYNNNSRRDNQILMKLISLARWMERYNFTWKKN